LIRKTITTQKVVLIKKTGTIMLQSVAQELAYPSMTCPISGKSFQMEDIIELQSASSGYAASGNVEATKHRPSMN
jgi:nitric oxide synthase-interacting protein